MTCLDALCKKLSNPFSEFRKTIIKFQSLVEKEKINVHELPSEILEYAVREKIEHSAWQINGMNHNIPKKTSGNLTLSKSSLGNYEVRNKSKVWYNKGNVEFKREQEYDDLFEIEDLLVCVEIKSGSYKKIRKDLAKLEELKHHFFPDKETVLLLILPKNKSPTVPPGHSVEIVNLEFSQKNLKHHIEEKIYEHCPELYDTYKLFSSSFSLRGFSSPRLSSPEPDTAFITAPHNPQYSSYQ